MNPPGSTTARRASFHTACGVLALAAFATALALVVTAWRPLGAPWSLGLWLPWGAVLAAGLGGVLAAIALWARRHLAAPTSQAALHDAGPASRLIGLLPFPALVVDSRARVVAANGAFSRDCGWPAREWQGLPFHQLLSPGQGSDEPDTRWETVLRHGRWQGPAWLRRRDRPAVMTWLTVGATQAADPAAGPFIVQACEMGSARPDPERLPVTGALDTLTGLPNRRLFVHDLTRAIDKAQRHDRRLAVLQINLDHFRQINDTLGRHNGDRVLAEMAHRLRRTVRAEDTVARAGGDQFLVVLEELSGQHDAARLARKIIGVMGETLEIDGSPWSVSASIGVAMYPGGGSDASQLMVAADMAMFRAKRHGRRTFAFCALPQAPTSEPDALQTQAQPFDAGPSAGLGAGAGAGTA